MFAFAEAPQPLLSRTGPMLWHTTEITFTIRWFPVSCLPCLDCVVLRSFCCIYFAAACQWWNFQCMVTTNQENSQCPIQCDAHLDNLIISEKNCNYHSPLWVFIFHISVWKSGKLCTSHSEVLVKLQQSTLDKNSIIGDLHRRFVWMSLILDGWCISRIYP